MDKPRALEEIKNDIRSRVGHRAPFNHADKQEAEEILSRLNSVEGEIWAAAWNQLGARWEEKARKAEAGGRRDEAKQAYLKSYGYYGIGRHPFPSTPGKQHAYLKAREMHLAASRFFDIPLERVAIPFHGKENRRPSAFAGENSRPPHHALGRHRQLERGTPHLRGTVRQRRLELFGARQSRNW